MKKKGHYLSIRKIENICQAIFFSVSASLSYETKQVWCFFLQSHANSMFTL